jgi:hypothetical protein
MHRVRGRLLLLVVLVALAPAACGGSAPSHRGRTVVFSGGGAFPPTTIAGRYSIAGCTSDARALVHDARSYYAHTHGGPGPADLYFEEMRLSYAHFRADGCTSGQLGREVDRSLTTRQRSFLLHDLAGNLRRSFRAALGAG